MPHWWVPVRGSKPEDRKDEVKRELGSQGKLHSFWEGSDGNLYAVVNDCDEIDEDLKRRMKVVGDPIRLEREV